jgi:hypothetical protein
MRNAASTLVAYAGPTGVATCPDVRGDSPSAQNGCDRISFTAPIADHQSVAPLRFKVLLQKRLMAAALPN